MLQHAASLARPCRVECVLALVDVLDDAILVDHEGGAVCKTVFLVQDAVLL